MTSPSAPAKTEPKTKLPSTFNPLPPRPRLILRLGGLGNRNFGSKTGIDENPAAIEQAAAVACNEVFAEIETILLGILHDEKPENQSIHWPEAPSRWKTHCLAMLFGARDRWERERRMSSPESIFSEDIPKVTVLTGGAEGGDVMIRDAAMARGARLNTPVDFEHLRITCLTPSAVPDGFGVGENPASPGALKAKVARSELLSRQEAADLAATVRKRSFGFRAQSEALRHHSDILLAVWDSDAEGKAGGTSESVAAALEERIPVIAICVCGPGKTETHLLESIEDLRTLQNRRAFPLHRSDWRTVLKQTLCSILKFPDPAPHLPKDDNPSDPTSYHPRIVFAAFLEGKPFKPIWPAKLWVIYQAFSKYRASPKPDKESRRRLFGKFPQSLKPSFASVVSQHIKSPAAGEEGTFAYCYGRAKDRAASKGMSGVYGDAHRGAILASYLFAALAVILALLGAILHFLHAPAPLLVSIAVTEVGVILVLYALSVCSEAENWNVAYTDSRILAEALRLMEYLGPMGIHTPIPRLPNYLRGKPALPMETENWAMWYFRALVRMAPLRLKSANPTDLVALLHSLKTGLIQKQIVYHQSNVEKHSQQHQDVEKFTKILFIVVFSGALLHVVDIFFIHSPWMFLLCLVICAGGPALISALHGLASQLETARLEKNSSIMDQLLNEQLRNLDALDLTQPDEATAVWGLATEALATASIMIEETASWSLLYKNTDIHAG